MRVIVLGVVFLAIGITDLFGNCPVGTTEIVPGVVVLICFEKRYLSGSQCTSNVDTTQATTHISITDEMQKVHGGYKEYKMTKHLMYELIMTILRNHTYLATHHY